jgi:hypothetical protein
MGKNARRVAGLRQGAPAVSRSGVRSGRGPSSRWGSGPSRGLSFGPKGRALLGPQILRRGPFSIPDNLRGGSTRLAHTPMGRTIRSARRVASRFLRHKTAIRSRRPSTLVPIRAGCVRSRTRGEVGMPRNTLSLVIAVLVIILLIVLILQFV